MANFLKSLFIKGVEIDTASATTGNSLIYNGTKFAPATPGSGSISLDGLSDVVITTPLEFQTLEYNGTNWVNANAQSSVYVRNVEATTITTGTCVYLFGATGDHATVKRADNNSDATSAKTVGVVSANIAASQNGVVVTQGYVDGIDLSTGYTAGDVLWLGEAGAFTKTKPTAPDHLVFIGVVVRANHNGIIYVATQNGYELDELHNVSLPSPASGDFLKYNGSLWVADAIDLGTDTTGNYVGTITAGTGVTTSGASTGEGIAHSISIGQSVATSATPTFAGGVFSTSSAVSSLSGVTPSLQVLGVTASTASEIIARYSADINGPSLYLGKSRSATAGTQTVVTTGDRLGNLQFIGSDGTNFIASSTIQGDAEGTISTGIVPGRLTFNTANSAGTLTERMRIDSAGNIAIGSSTIAGYGFYNAKQITGALSSYGITAGGTVQSDVTSTASQFLSAGNTANASFTLSSYIHFYAFGVTTPGTGSTITTQTGFLVSSSTTGATNNYGFRGDIPSGTNRYNLYMSGTAQNYLAGNTAIGATAADTGATLRISNSSDIVGIRIRAAAAQAGQGLIQVQDSSGNLLSGIAPNGNFHIGTVPSTSTLLRVNKSLTGGVSPVGYYITSAIDSDYPSIIGGTGYFSFIGATSANVASPPNIANINHHYVGQGTFTNTTVTNQYGYYADSSLTGATNNYGYFGNIAAATGRWNLYMGGSANNYLAGALGVGSNSLTGITLNVAKTITGATSAYGIVSQGSILNDVTSQATAFQSGMTTAASTALGALFHYTAYQNTFGAGSSVTNQYGFYVSSGMVSATNNYGFRGDIPNGTNRWNLYMGGSAQNYLAGNLGIGTATPSTALQVVGTVTATAFAGPLTGNVTGNVSGSAATVTGAAQSAITSVGTLSALRVDGNFGIGGAGFAQIGLRFVKDIGGSAFSQGIFLGGAVQPSVTSRADMIWTAPTVAASVTLPTLQQFYATVAGVGAGSTITASTGFYAESNIGNNDLGTITNAYGFLGNIASGTGRYNLYMQGTAANYMAGRLGVGAILTSGAMAIVQNTTAADKAFIVRGAASQSGDFLDVQNSGGTSQFKVDSSGAVGIGNTPAAGRSFVLGKSMTGSIAPIGFFSAGQIQSDATNSANYFNTFVNTAATAFTCGTVIHYKTQQGTIGAGSSIGTQVGFLAESSLIGATGNNLGFWGAIPADAAKNYNLYMSGTAPNYLLGRLGVGATLTSGAMAQIVNTTAADKAFVVKGAASQSGDFFDVQDSSGASEFKIDSSGRVGVNASTSAGTQLIIGGTTDSSALGSGIASGQTLSSTMLDYKGFWSLPALPAGSNTYTQLLHFHANPSAIGAGTTLSTSAGFVASSSLGSNFSGTVTTAYGFWGNLASGTNRYNLYMGGTAQNYMAGNLGIGTTTPDTALDVVGTTTLKTVKAGSGVVAISTVSYDGGFNTTNYFTSTAHGFSNGDTVTITGVTPTNFNITTVISVASSNHFYISGGLGASSGTGGTATGPPSTLYVNSTNDRIGIGTSSPTEKLDVVGNIALTGSVVFEGATADGFETTLAVTDPTGSDKTITLPNASGTVALVGTQTVRSITASTDTPTGADLGDLLTIDTTSGAVTVTINSSLGLTAGQRIDFMWIGAATSVTFSASSVTLNGTPGLKLRARYSAATLVCTASNTYVLVGDLSA
jgi:hypothetical protein